MSWSLTVACLGGVDKGSMQSSLSQLMCGPVSAVSQQDADVLYLCQRQRLSLQFGPLQDLQDSSDEEEGEGNEYDVTDKFLVADDDEAEDNDEDGAEGDAATKRRKKRRRRREAEEELDEEDYELIVSTSAHVACYSPWKVASACMPERLPAHSKNQHQHACPRGRGNAG